MSQLNVQIEDRLRTAGYKTERSGDVVQVHDPVHASLPGKKTLVLSHHVLREIRTMPQAWKFIEERD